MAKNTTHKYWFWCVHEPSEEAFYIAIPIKDKESLQLVHCVMSALNAINADARSYIIPFSAIKAYQDMRAGIPWYSLDHALSLWREILSYYFTKPALDIIFHGF